MFMPLFCFVSLVHLSQKQDKKNGNKTREKKRLKKKCFDILIDTVQ